MRVRELTPQDRPAILDMLRACGTFSDIEIEVAAEVLDAGLSGGPENAYTLLGLEIDGHLRGYVCIGPTPMTATTWHLFWIAVHPAAQRQRAGRRLQQAAEQFIRDRAGERIVLETSGRPDYEGARRFYEQAGYKVVGRIGDYYKPGDDCVFYCKVLT